MKPKVFCACSMGLNRSKWVANYLKEKGYETRYGGVGPCKFDPEPANPAKKEDLEWADIIITARNKHIPIIENNFGIKGKKIIALEVSDSRRKAIEIHPELENLEDYEFNEKWTYPKLKEALEHHLPLDKYFK